MTIIEIDVATALELLRADGTVVLHAAEAGVEITLPVRVALDTPTTPTPRVRPAPPAAPKPKPAKTAPPPDAEDDDRPWKCDVCGRRFSRQNGMMRHRNYEHATAKPAPAEPPAPAAPKLAPVPGPMERRPFDPDRVRANAANGI